jgi:serine/threonine protein kinase
MCAEHNKNEEAIFNAAIEIDSPAERAAFVKSACGDDTTLLARVEAMLKVHFEDESFLKSPPGGMDVTLDAGPLTEGPGSRIGRYKLLQLIGEGGFGVVYMAEQEEPIRRKVALKIIKLGMDTKQVIARFEAERQALAMMDHPNIARVFDAGATDTGRPYFVMELVKGIPITEYCDKNNLGTRQRLELFIDVCKAVQHAHQKGIIHRDIKPSNVMITLHDGKPVPKIIDFGIAKATQHRLTEKTFFTEYRQFIGTPEYMSPEQAEMGGLDVDTRTDIYSLGVLLYELLTGTTPFEADKLRSAAYDEIRRIIREDEPPKPSTRLSTLGDALTNIAKHRDAQPGELCKIVRGDLDWVVMKSLEKDRTRRYETANELAMDIERHLGDEPVSAGPPSNVYRLRKFVRRHRTGVAAGLLVAAAIVVGLVVSTTMYFQAEQAREKENAARIMAEQARQKETAARTQAEQALNSLAKLETQVEADRSLSTVQKLYAEGRYQAALAEIETNLQRGDGGPKARLLHAHLLFEVDRFSDAAAELEKLLTEQPEIAGAAHYLLARSLIGSDPNKSEKHRQFAELLLPQTAEAFSLRGITAGTPEKTIEWLSKALELDPSHYASRKARALAYYAMKDYQNMEKDVEALIVIRPKDSFGYALRAIARREMGRLEEAIRDHDYAIKICDVEAELAELYDQRRETYLCMGNYRAALEDAQRCVKLQPEEVVYHFHVFTALVSLGQYDAAREEYREIIGPDPSKKSKKWWFNGQTMRYVFNVLGAGRPFELPADIALKEPFSAMQEAVGYYRALESKAVRLIPSVFGQTSWSPDGKQLAYGRIDQYAWQPETLRAKEPNKALAQRGDTDRSVMDLETLRKGASAVYRSSGIEILDIESGKTRLLVSSGKDPAWSPDGRYIAFIREAYEEEGWVRFEGEPCMPVIWRWDEVWLIPTTGEEPRRLTRGNYFSSSGWPIWANDSRRLFFISRGEGKLCSIRVDDPNAKPEEIVSVDNHGTYPCVSPDEKYVAYALGNKLIIKEMSSGSVVTEWTAPGPEKGMLVRWSPDGKEVFLSGYHDSDLGLWSFDVERQEAWQIFDAPAIMGTLSPDQSRMAVELRQPFGEIWLAKLNPTIPTYHALAPVLTREEFLRHRCERYTREAKSNALDESSSSYATQLMEILASQGREYYQKGTYEEALTMLSGVEDIRRAINEAHFPDACNNIHNYAFDVFLNKSRPSNTAFIAMSLFRLGRNQEAQASLEQLQQMFEDDQYASEEHYLCEVEQLFAGENSKVYPAWERIKAGKLDEASQLVEELGVLEDPNIAGRTQSITKALARALYRRVKAGPPGKSYSEMIADYEAVVHVDTNYAKAFNDLAWLRIACPLAELHDGVKAIGAATKACELTNWKNHDYVSTLAIAYSEAGDFAAAIKWQKEAIGLLPEDNRAAWQRSYEARLKLYQSGKVYSKNFPAEKTVAWYKFDEVKDGNVVDSSGNNLHGKLIGDAKIISDPERGNVLSLDGDGDYVDCGNDTAFDITDQITVAVWIKVNELGRHGVAIVTKGNSAWNLGSDWDRELPRAILKFGCALVGKETWLFGSKLSGGAAVEGTMDVNDGKWHHVAGVYDGTEIHLYVDGVLDKDEFEKASRLINTSNFHVLIGENGEDTGRHYWNGLIDDVRIYSYALSEAEIKILYAGKDPSIRKD